MKRKVKRNLFKKRENKMMCGSSCSCGGGIYGLGFIGAAVFYIQGATLFWDGVLGVLKAIVWPAFLIYKLFGM